MKKSRKKISELELQSFCGQYFRDQGFLIQDEVPFLFKVADLFCFNEETGECIAIEVKIRNWRQALKQAIVYQMTADRVYIALSSEHSKHVDSNLLISNNIGLLEITDEGFVRNLIEAPPSPRRRSYFVSSTIARAFPHSSSIACLIV